MKSAGGISGERTYELKALKAAREKPESPRIYNVHSSKGKPSHAVVKNGRFKCSNGVSKGHEKGLIRRG